MGQELGHKSKSRHEALEEQLKKKKKKKKKEKKEETKWGLCCDPDLSLAG